MKRFKLAAIDESDSVQHALADIIEFQIQSQAPSVRTEAEQSKVRPERNIVHGERGELLSAILVRSGNMYRIVSFQDLVAASEQGLPLTAVEGKPVLTVLQRNLRDEDVNVKLLDAERDFALLNPGATTADLLSSSETNLRLYEVPSGGARCSRSGGPPPGMTPRDWYHYFPATPRKPSPNEHECPIDGSYVP